QKMSDSIACSEISNDSDPFGFKKCRIQLLAARFQTTLTLLVSARFQTTLTLLVFLQQDFKRL
ncbi:MAG: hypothetical protein JSW45_06745, partial [Thiotrichales bacterium]